MGEISATRRRLPGVPATRIPRRGMQTYKYLHKNGNKEVEQTAEAVAEALATGEFRADYKLEKSGSNRREYPVWESGSNQPKSWREFPDIVKAAKALNAILAIRQL